MPAHQVPRLRKSRLPRGAALTTLVKPVIQPMPTPPVPQGLLKVSQDDWRDFWTSPQAAHVVSAHLPALRRLFDLRDQRERFARAGRKSSMSTGSKDQLVLNPLVKHLSVLDADILSLEDRFGLSPKHSIALSEGFDDAARAAAEANAALASGFEPPEAEPEQPRTVRRLAAVE